MVESCVFLSAKRASDWVLSYHTKYIHKTQSCPRNAAVRTYYDSSSFSEHLLDWTPTQEQRLRMLVTWLIGSCWSWRRLLRHDAWIFIQSNNQLESGMPHTIEQAIVLPQWLVKVLMSVPTELGVDRTIVTTKEHAMAVETLLHERVHVLQKLYPERFSRLYYAWGYTPVPSYGPTRIAVSNIHHERTFRFNPDTPNEWLWKDHLYPFVELLNSNGYTTSGGAGDKIASRNTTPSLQNCAYYLVDIRPSSMIREHSSSMWYPMNSHQEYKRHHGEREHCYHPDETSAVLIAEEIYRDVYHRSSDSNRKSKDPNCEALKSIRRWCADMW